MIGSFISFKMLTCRSYDDVAWEISTQIWEDQPELLRTDSDIYNDIGVILCEEFNDLKQILFEFLNTSGFNTYFKIKFTNNSGAIMFPKEKVRNKISII